jgi:excisionase family DNA binding protein
MNIMIQNSENPGAAVCVKKAATILGVSTRTVWRMIAAGELSVIHVRGCTRLLQAQVLGYLNGNGKANSL